MVLFNNSRNYSSKDPTSLTPICNPPAPRASVQDVKAKCVNVVRGSHVCGFAWCWTDTVSRE